MNTLLQAPARDGRRLKISISPVDILSFLPLSWIGDTRFSLKSEADLAALKALPQLRDFSWQVRRQ